MDRNGARDTSEVRSLRFGEERSFRIEEAYGHPDRGIDISLRSERSKRIEFKAFDTMGRERYRTERWTRPGRNDYELPFKTGTPGIYTLRVTDLKEGSTRTRKFSLFNY